MAKSLWFKVLETIEQHYDEQRASAPEQDVQPRQLSRLHRFLRWLTPNGGTLLLIGVLILTQNVWARQTASPAAPGPSATTVNYQGRLADPAGNPKNGTFGMSFSLWDAATGGNLVRGPESHPAVPIAGMALTVPNGAIGTAQVANGAVTDDNDLSRGFAQAGYQLFRRRRGGN